MLTIERYPGSRFWALYEHGQLLCVTVYKKGAEYEDAHRARRTVPATRASASGRTRAASSHPSLLLIGKRAGDLHRPLAHPASAFSLRLPRAWSPATSHSSG